MSVAAARNVYEMAAEAGASDALAMIDEAGLSLFVKGTDGITVMIPSNDAIAVST